MLLFLSSKQDSDEMQHVSTATDPPTFLELKLLGAHGVGQRGADLLPIRTHYHKHVFEHRTLSHPRPVSSKHNETQVQEPTPLGHQQRSLSEKGALEACRLGAADMPVC